jgi:hypothetical protein
VFHKVQYYHSVISSDFESEYMCLSHKATSIFESQYSLHSQSHSIAHVTSIFSPVIYGFHHYAQYFVFQNHPIVVSFTPQSIICWLTHLVIVTPAFRAISTVHYSFRRVVLLMKHFRPVDVSYV